VAPRTCTKRMSLKEITLRAPNMITIVLSMIKIIKGGYSHDHLMSTITFTLIINKVFIGAPKTMRGVAKNSI
jgi:hypothetical protein